MNIHIKMNNTLYDVGLLETLCFILTNNAEIWFLEDDALIWAGLNGNDEPAYLVEWHKLK